MFLRFIRLMAMKPSTRLATECLGLRIEIAIAQVAEPKSLFESPTENQQALS